MRETLVAVMADGRLSLSGRLAAHEVIGLWARVAGSTPRRDFALASQPAGADFSFEVDLDLLLRSLGTGTGRYDLWLTVVGPLGAPVRSSVRLGPFDSVDRSAAVDAVPVGDTCAWLHVAENGQLAVVLADAPPRKVRATTRRLTVGEHGVRLEQGLESFSRPVESAVGSWTQRASGERHETPLQVTERTDAPQDGLFRYDLSGTIAPPATGGGDDVHDPFVEVRLRGIADPVRVVIRPAPRRRHRTRLREIVVDRGEHRQVLIPHLTFRGRRLAFWSETFTVENHDYLRRLRWYSWLFFLVRPFLRIWLVGETPYKAQDNGYAFFAWVRSEHPKRRAYYVIEADSPDRAKVEQHGHVVLRHSRDHVRLTLLASRFVGSHHAEYLYASRSRSVVRRVGGIRIFLQHGVTAMKNVTLNYGLRRMVEAAPDVFCVNAPAEQDIVVRELEYRPAQVPITGFTRFDALLAGDVEVEPRLLVMPTWRDWLSDRADVERSDFVRQWIGFLDAVVPIAAEHALTVDLVLHPNMRHRADLFERPGVTMRAPGDDLQRLLKSTTLLVTDYSSVGWDFSFLDRPVVYFQFDHARFTGGRPPYIDYPSQLPGDTATTSAAAVDRVAEALALGSLREDLRTRSRAFLAQADHGACQRTFDVVRRADGPLPRLRRVRTAIMRRDLDDRARRLAGRVKRLLGRAKHLVGRLRRQREAPPADPVAQLRRLRPRIEAAPRSTDEAWKRLRSAVDPLATDLAPEAWRRLTLHDRITAWLVSQDRRDDVTVALVDIDRFGRSFRSVRDDPDRLARPGYLEALSADLPDWLLQPSDDDLPLRLSVDQTPSGERLHLHGTGYVQGMRHDAAEDTLTLHLHDRGQRLEVPLTFGVDPLIDPAIDTTSGDRWCSYAESGFRAIVHPHPGPGSELEVEVTAGGVTRSRRVAIVPAADGDGATVTSVRSEGERLVVGLTGLPEGARLTAPGRLRPLPLAAVAEGVEITLADERRAVDSGRHELRAIDVDGEPLALVAGDDLASVLPVDGCTPWVGWRVAVRDGAVEITLRSALPMDERGRFNQRRLVEQIDERPGTLQDAVLALCFSGRGAGDSVEPLAESLTAELGWPVRWGVTDRAVQVPSWAEPVLIHSREWHEALATSRVLLNNAHFPHYFAKRPGQAHVQTWHGTPLKRIGNDVPPESLSLSYRDLMAHEATAWDLLLAQSDYAAQVMAPAFGYDGHVLTTGYPRNDALVAPTAASHREEVRRRLGLATDETAVLYAPTWRDEAKTDQNQAALVTHLDPARLRALLGERVRVLLRGHSNTSRGRGTTEGVIDVTDDADLPGLFLAADVLVTDYSSVMFDFAVTGAPLVFLAPDLDRYRRSTRGFYVDLAEVAPGPVVSTTDELAEWLADLDALSHDWRARREAFVERFAPYDDGRATDRVTAQVLELLGVRTA